MFFILEPVSLHYAQMMKTMKMSPDKTSNFVQLEV